MHTYKHLTCAYVRAMPWSRGLNHNIYIYIYIYIHKSCT